MKLNNVTKKYKDFILEVDLEIKKGEIFGIVGKSGSGKSTILKIIQNILSIDGGQIEKDYKETSYIFQDYNLLGNKTVFENVALPLKLKGNYSKEAILESLEFVGIEDKKDSYPSSLSGGQKQRVAIARAIVTKPELLLCDEVTSSLDYIVKEDILDLFIRINKNYGTTIIMVTHELDVAKRMCDRVAVIEAGKILDVFSINKENSKIKDKDYLSYVKGVLL